ncbi:MAG: hypothetical protein PVH84_05390 [Candidatus Aminicenantes bacterium]
MTSERTEWWFENTPGFPRKETSLGRGALLTSPSGDVPCPLSPSHGCLHHTIGILNNGTHPLAITVEEMLSMDPKLFGRGGVK